MTKQATSPYLNRPLRTLEQFEKDQQMAYTSRLDQIHDALDLAYMDQRNAREYRLQYAPDSLEYAEAGEDVLIARYEVERLEQLLEDY